MFMEELFHHLELRIKNFITQHSRLQQKLQRHEQSCVQEKEFLFARQEKAIKQIEGLLSKLKALEKLS